MWVDIGCTRIVHTVGVTTDVVVYTVVEQQVVRVHHIPSGWWLGFPVEEFPAHVLQAGHDAWRHEALQMALHTLHELQHRLP